MDFWDFFWLLFIFVPLVMVWAFALVDVFWRHDLSGGMKALWVDRDLRAPVPRHVAVPGLPAGRGGEPAPDLDAGRPPGPDRVAHAADDHAGQLQTLADLHDRGKLTDAEFATEKQRLIGG